MEMVDNGAGATSNGLGGYVCPSCGNFIYYGAIHACNGGKQLFQHQVLPSSFNRLDLILDELRGLRQDIRDLKEKL